MDKLVLARQELTCSVRDPRIARERGYEGIGYEVRVKLIAPGAASNPLKILDRWVREEQRQREDRRAQPVYSSCSRGRGKLMGQRGQFS